MKIKLAKDNNIKKYNRYFIRSFVEDNSLTQWCPSPRFDYAVDYIIGSGCYDVICENSAEDVHTLVDQFEYRSIVGALQHLSLTYPDISRAVNILCQFISTQLLPTGQGSRESFITFCSLINCSILSQSRRFFECRLGRLSHHQKVHNNVEVDKDRISCDLEDYPFMCLLEIALYRGSVYSINRKRLNSLYLLFSSIQIQFNFKGKTNYLSILKMSYKLRLT